MDDNYSVLDYVPVVGDIYRYAKLGYNIGSWIAGDEKNDRLLVEMHNCISRAAQSDDIQETADIIHEFTQLSDQYKGGKKYQNVFYAYTVARAIHVMILTTWAINATDLDSLKKDVGDLFDKAFNACNSALNIQKTIATDKRDLIDSLREATRNEIAELKETKKRWRKYCRLLDKKLHPWKYRLMWIIPLVILLISLFVATLFL